MTPPVGSHRGPSFRFWYLPSSAFWFLATRAVEAEYHTRGSGGRAARTMLTRSNGRFYLAFEKLSLPRQKEEIVAVFRLVEETGGRANLRRTFNSISHTR